MDMFEGQIAFVTGAANGIGAALARTFAGAGMGVALADVDLAGIEALRAELDDTGARAIAIALDVRDRNAWQEARLRTEALLGPVALLCNNAGVTGYDRIVDTPPDYWDWLIGVNLTGVFNGISTFGQAMIARGEPGAIVNTASIAGIYGSRNFTVGAYAASKFGVVGLSERLRVELAPHGIGVSVLCPGLVSTMIGANAKKLRPVPGAVDLADNPAFARLRANAPVTGMPADAVGPFVLQAIRDNRQYIFTHPEFSELVEDRHAAIMADFGASALPEVPPHPDWMATA